MVIVGIAGLQTKHQQHHYDKRCFIYLCCH